MSDDNWPVEWLRGSLELCVLAVISRGTTYGYAIAQELQSAGLGEIKGGTLYPLLSRCERAYLVEVDWRQGESGPGRKYYSISAAGREYLQHQSRRWIDFTATAGELLTTTKEMS